MKEDYANEGLVMSQWSRTTKVSWPILIISRFHLSSTAELCTGLNLNYNKPRDISPILYKWWPLQSPFHIPTLNNIQKIRLGYCPHLLVRTCSTQHTAFVSYERVESNIQASREEYKAAAHKDPTVVRRLQHEWAMWMHKRHSSEIFWAEIW